MLNFASRITVAVIAAGSLDSGYCIWVTAKLGFCNLLAWQAIGRPFQGSSEPRFLIP
jgi:hypothetical protein